MRLLKDGHWVAVWRGALSDAGSRICNPGAVGIVAVDLALVVPSDPGRQGSSPEPASIRTTRLYTGCSTSAKW